MFNINPGTSDHVRAWMEAYMQAQANKPIQQEEEKEKPLMEGGWQFEGKEKPTTPRICARCQWIPRTDGHNEPDREDWCEGCLISPGIGHTPPNWKPLDMDKVDARALNKSFFG